jgi:environmental stress-induced protein Ves
MSWHTMALADVPPSPWKNGGGSTRELLAWPSQADWRWRMSVAEVAQDGPFSRFDGVQRWLAVLSGAGLRLDVGLPSEGQVHTLTPRSAPLCFDGAQPVHCTLLGRATQDFNLMRRGGPDGARMLRVDGEYACSMKTIKIIAVYPGNTWATVHFDDEVLRLPTDTLAWRTCAAGTRLQVIAEQALWMEIDP